MSETKNLKLFKHDEPLESNESIFDIDKSLSKNWDKLDEYSVGIDAKIQALETDNTKNKQDISNIQAEQKTQNITIESLQKENAEIKEENIRLKEDLNAFPTVNGSGEYVTLDTADSRFKKFKIIGKSVQETREGYNLCNVTDQTKYGVTFKKTKNGILLNGKSTETFDVTVCEKTVAGGNYCIKGLGSMASNSTFQEVIYKNDTIDCYVATTSKICTFADNDVLKSRFYIYKDTTFNNLLVPVQITKNDDKDYEPYGAMPSTEFSSEIRNVGDNGNLYDKDNPNILDTPIDTSGLGGNVKNTYKTVWIPCKPNTTYTVSKKYDATKNRFALAYTSEEPNYSQQVEGYVSNAYTNVMTITTNSTAKYLIAYVWIAGGSVTYQEMLDSIKIEKGTQATADNGHGLGSMEIIICNKNILNQDLELFQGNYDNNGNVITNSDRRIDKYIFLAKGNYILWSTINNWINVLIYDKNKKLLSVKNSNTNKENAFTLDEDGYIRFGFNPTVESLKVFQLERNTEKTTSEEHKQQIIIFPFKQGQKLMQGDYLADDGIHNTKTQIQLDGVTNGLKVSKVTKHSNNIYYCVINLVKQSINNTTDVSSMYCSHFMPHFEVKPGSCYIAGSGLYLVLVLTDQTITTVDAANTWLATQKEKGIPVVIEYKLAEEVVEPYTEVQKEAWKQIENAKSYEGQTNIFSNNDVSPVFEVTARRDLNAILNSLQSQILAD